MVAIWASFSLSSAAAAPLARRVAAAIRNRICMGLSFAGVEYLTIGPCLYNIQLSRRSPRRAAASARATSLVSRGPANDHFTLTRSPRVTCVDSEIDEASSCPGVDSIGEISQIRFP